MAEQEKRRGRGRPKGTPASAAQKATVKQAQKVSAAKRAERKKAREAAAAEARALEQKVKPRWEQLEDGDISVTDLTLDELTKKVCANNDGSWDGRRHHFNARMIQRMESERLRRLKNLLSEHTSDAIDAIGEIINDSEHNQRLAASKLAIEYDLGKPVEVIHVGQETEWDRLSQAGFVILRGKENVSNEEVDEDGPLELEAKEETA